MQVVASFMMIVMIFIMYPRVSVSVKRINEVLDTEEYSFCYKNIQDVRYVTAIKHLLHYLKL